MSSIEIGLLLLWFRFVRRLPDRDSDGLRADAIGQTLNKPKPEQTQVMMGRASFFGQERPSNLSAGP